MAVGSITKDFGFVGQSLAGSCKIH